ncbi:MAG: hypothetical protein E2598_04990 [Sphingobium sp.]|nr:hypothetical protein [Sphingobium sp.]
MTLSAPTLPPEPQDDAFIRWLRRGWNAPLMVALLWLGLCAIMLVSHWPNIIALDFRDPDDAMRMVQVRDFLAGQSWFDVSQHRVNPPYGGPMHWSRLLDLPIAALILLFRPIVGMDIAERIAAALVPLLILGAICFTIYASARRLMSRPVAVLTVALLLSNITLLAQTTPLRIDHHDWQILMMAVMVYGLLHPSPLRGGLIIGGAIALWLHISTEGLPYAAIIGAILALRYAVKAQEGPRLMAYVMIMSVGSALLLWLTHGWKGSLISYCDAMSPLYLTPLILLCAITALGQRFIGNESWLRRLLPVTIGAGAAAALYMMIAGPCINGPFRTLDPLVYNLWYLAVMEGLPITRQSLAMTGIIIAPSLVGMVGLFMAGRAETDPDRALEWHSLLIALLGCFLVSLMVMRTMATAHVVAVLGTGWLLARLHASVARHPVMPVRALLTSLLILLTPLGSAMVTSSAIKLFSSQPHQQDEGNQPVPFDTKALRTLPPVTILAPIDLGPAILLYTHHNVIGTAHHRNIAGLKIVIQAFTAPPAEARRIIAATKADYLLLPAHLPETDRYDIFAPKGLAAQMSKGHRPDWLIPVHLPGNETGLYRIIRTAK